MGPQAAPSSLVSYRHIAASGRCERVDWDLLNDLTGEVVSGRCKAYRCVFCGPRKLQLLELCLVAAVPERFVTLTWAPGDRKQRRDQVAGLHRRIRESGRRWEMAWTTEPNPAGTGFHIHGLQKGDYLGQPELQERWGDRVVDIRRLRNVGGGVGAYMLKVQRGVTRGAGYVLKQQDGERARPVNITRGFFDGRTLGDVRADVTGLLYGERDDAGVWRRVPRERGW